MTWLALRVLLGGWTKSAWAFVCRYPLQAALLASLACNVWLWQSRADCLAVKQETKAAQKQATADQATVNHEPARVSGEIARKSDVDASAYYEAGRRAGAAYAATHRVRAPACPGGAPDLPGANHPAAVDDRPGIDPDMVAVSRADFDTLTGNTIRLAKVHQDAESMIAAGVAVPSEKEGD